MDLYKSERTKYDVPLNHLDYNYIESCSDIKELEKIVKVLRSGYEGTYPELEKLAETTLSKFNPDSKVLRKDKPAATKHDLSNNEWQNINEAMTDWEVGMKQAGNDSAQPASDLPPVRGQNINIGKSSSDQKAQKNPMPRDHKEWDKVDIDAELARVDGKEGPSKPKANLLQNKPNLPSNITDSGLSETEKEAKAEQEKVKGNEAFRAGDYSEALLYYTRSLNLHKSPAAHNNRAQTYLKLEKWADARKECDCVLKLEPENLKAYLRRAVARQGSLDYSSAKKDLQHVLSKEPNNKRAQTVLNEVEKAMKEAKVKGRRMVIEEVEGSDAEEEPSDGTNVNGHGSDVESGNRTTVLQNGVSSNNEGRDVCDGSKLSHNKPKSSPNTVTQSDRDHAGKMSSCPPNVNNADKTCIDENKRSGSAGDQSSSQRSEIDLAQEKSTRQQVPANTDFTQNSRPEPASADVVIDSSSGIKNISISDDKSEPYSDQAKIPMQPSVTESKAAEDVPKVTLPPPPPLPRDVIEFKDKGNEMFRTGQYSEAQKFYGKAIKRLEAGDELLRPHLAVLYSNQAACHHKLGDCQACISLCDQSLSINPAAVKPYLRRATAYETREKLREAYVDYRQVLLLDNTIQAAQDGSTRCMQMLRQQDGIRWREKLPKTKSITPSINQLHQPSSSTRPHTKTAATTTAMTTATTTNSKPTSQTPSNTQGKQELCDRHKSQGNDLVKRGQYSEAIPCYSQCIEACPDHVPGYTNRALCYLKTKQPSLAIADCTKALSLDPNNIKALFRRALAHKDEENYGESVDDMKTLLKVDTTNSAARKEFALILRLKQQSEERKKTSKKAPEKPRQRVQIQEVESSSEEEDTVPEHSKDKSCPQAKKPTQESPSIDSVPSASKAAPNSVKTNPDKNTKTDPKSKSREDRKKTAQNKASSVTEKRQSSKKKDAKQTATQENQPKSVPELQRFTPFEFMQAWTSLKGTNDVQLYANLLQQVEPKSLKEVLSNKLDGEMLMNIIRCTQELCKRGNGSRGLDYILNLPNVPRFKMVSMFMSSKEKKDVADVINELKVALGERFTAKNAKFVCDQYGVPL